jgi:hypothetical protein
MKRNFESRIAALEARMPVGPATPTPDYAALRARWERHLKMTDEEKRIDTQPELEREAALAISTPVAKLDILSVDYFSPMRYGDKHGYFCFSIDHWTLRKDEPFGLAARHLIAELRGEPPDTWGSADCLNADGVKTYRDTLARLRDYMIGRLGQRPLNGLMASRSSYKHYEPLLKLAIRTIRAQTQ